MNQTAALPENRQPFTIIPPETRVVPQYRYVAEKVDCIISRYSDDMWDLEIGVAPLNLDRTKRYIDFNRYEEFKECIGSLLKPFVWCCLNLDHVTLNSQQRDLAPGSVKVVLLFLLRYLRFLRNRGVTIDTATPKDNHAWMAQFRTRSYSVRVRAAGLVVRLHLYRSYLGVEVTEGDPWAHTTHEQLLGRRPSQGENTTPRVPRVIMEPMLRWALFYVQHASHDIMFMLTARTDRSECIEERKFCHLPGTSVPWSTPADSMSVFKEVEHLIAAAYIIVAYLSGMRDSEVQSIKDKGWRVERSESGQVVRYLLDAIATKTKRGLPKKRTWVVLAEVHEALECLSRLSVTMQAVWPDLPGTLNANLVFRRFRWMKVRDAALQTRPRRLLNAFQSHINSLVDEIGASSQEPSMKAWIDLYRIPNADNGLPWRWTTKHFRRTIAWYIANEPFGFVAGRRQFGHVRDTIYQGYAGHPDAGFRDDVARAAATGRELDLLEMYQAVQRGEHLAGPMGMRLEIEFGEYNAKHGNEAPVTVADDQRLQAMLRNRARTLYPGLYNDCLFSPDTALCLKGGASGQSLPIFARCDWEKCPNSCITAKHGPILRQSLADAQSYRKTRRLSKIQRQALDAVSDKYQRTLRRISNENSRP